MAAAADNLSIKILVSCHKPVRWPVAECYLPVHVGAEAAGFAIDGTQPDNEGENISARNFTFCEMTAQYWGWKHVDADYVGLCHYRRYFCFDGIEHAKNDHAQIEIDCLSDARIQEYQLANEALIRSNVERYDIVVPERWTVDEVPTPIGPQPSVRKHMVAYGLMDEGSIDELLKICGDLKPEYEPYVREYLEGNVYQGYNCFIMKKDLFDQLCEFEFEVLQAFDSAFDYTDLTTTRKRVIGYFGEILISAFTMRAERERGCVVAQRPLTFFEDTPSPAVPGEHGGSAHDEELVWHYPLTSPHLLAVGLNSFFRSPMARSGMGLTVITPPRFDRAKALLLSDVAVAASSITWLTWPVINGMPSGVGAEDQESLVPFVLPWLMPQGKRAYYARGPVVFSGEDFRTESISLMAAQNIHLQRELNKPAMNGVSIIADGRGRNKMPLGVHFVSLDLEFLREQFSMDDIVALFALTKRRCEDEMDSRGWMLDGALAAKIVQAKVLEELGFVAMPFTFASQALLNDDTKRWANESPAREWSFAESPLVLALGEDGVPNANFDISHSAMFWASARNTMAYERLLLDGVSREACRVEGMRLRDRLLPEGSRRRSAARAVASVIRSR